MAKCNLYCKEENKDIIQKDSLNYVIKEIPKEKIMEIPNSNYKIKNNIFQSNLNEIILKKYLNYNNLNIYKLLIF